MVELALFCTFLIVVINIIGSLRNDDGDGNGNGYGDGDGNGDGDGDGDGNGNGNESVISKCNFPLL